MSSVADTAQYPDGLTREQWLARIEERRNSFYRSPENPQQRIWRYMDFTKLLAMLDTGTLYFSSAARLGDPFEGSVSKENVRRRPEMTEQMVGGFQTGFDDWKPSSEQETRIRSMLQTFHSTRAQMLEWERHWTYVNCWHMADWESAAMWRLYAPSGQGIAVQSTFARLKDCLRAHVRPPMGEPLLGTVYYVDYERDLVPRDTHLSEFFYKRTSFAHEAELRAVMQELPHVGGSHSGQYPNIGGYYDFTREPCAGKSLSVDFERLIEAVYVAPTSPEWLTELIRHLVAKYGLDKPVKNSGLDATPVY